MTNFETLSLVIYEITFLIENGRWKLLRTIDNSVLQFMLGDKIKVLVISVPL